MSAQSSPAAVATQPLPEGTTTLMFRYIPRKFSARHLMAELEDRLPKTCFDFVYVPWDRTGTSNMGYGFVNFVSPCYAEEIRDAMNGTTWRQDRRHRHMVIVPAHVQGLEINLQRYTNSGAEPEAMHEPLILINGMEIPLQRAIRYVSAAKPVPTNMTNTNEVRAMHLPSSNKKMALLAPPPGLEARSALVDDAAFVDRRATVAGDWDASLLGECDSYTGFNKLAAEDCTSDSTFTGSVTSLHEQRFHGLEGEAWLECARGPRGSLIMSQGSLSSSPLAPLPTGPSGFRESCDEVTTLLQRLKHQGLF